MLPKKFSNIPKMFLLLGLLKKLKEDKRHAAINEFKHELKDLRNILNKIKELKLLREQKERKN